MDQQIGPKQARAETTLAKATQAEQIECRNGSGPKRPRAELTRFGSQNHIVASVYSPK